MPLEGSGPPLRLICSGFMSSMSTLSVIVGVTGTGSDCSEADSIGSTVEETVIGLC